MTSLAPSVGSLLAGAVRASLVTMRPYQADLDRRITDYWAANPTHNICMVLPTGGGKTAILAERIRKHLGNSLTFAHRNELVCQLSMALARCGIRHRIIADEEVVRAIIKLQIEKFGVHFHYAAAQAGVGGALTLLGKKAQRAHGAWLAEVTLAIPDEAHHVLRDNTWGKVLAFTPKARVLGPTAWPGRSDGKGIGAHAKGVFHTIIAGPSMPELTRMGYLTPLRVFCPPGDFRRADLEVSKTTGEFTAASTQAAVGKSSITGDAVEQYLAKVPGKTAFIFTPDVKNATLVASNFNARGIRAAMLSGETDTGVRLRTMAEFERREVKVVANVALFGEGTDIPNLDAVFMEDPTQSYCKFLQEAGRAARLSIDKAIFAHWETYTDEQRRAFIAASDKPYGFLIDQVGNVKQHGLPGHRTDYSLNDRERGGRAKPSDVMPTTTCMSCAGEYEATKRECPYCEKVQVPSSRKGPEFVDGDLYELDQETMLALEHTVKVAQDAPNTFGLNAVAAAGQQNRHHEKMQARAALRETMALWGGWRQAQGDQSHEAMRRFYFQFGVDVMTALTLTRADTVNLNERLRTVLTNSSVRSSVAFVYNEELPE